MQNSYLRLAKYFDLAAWVVLLLGIFCVPIIFDSTLVNQFVLPKEYAVGLIALVVLVIWTCKVIVLRKVDYLHTKLDLPILILLITSIISALFSGLRNASFLGHADYFALNALFLIFLGIISIAFVQYCRTIKQWQQAIDVFLGVGAVTILVFLIKIFFNKDLLSLWLPNVWSSVDSANSLFGIWLVIIFVMAAGQLIKRKIGGLRVASYGLLVALSFLALILLNYGIIWWMLLVGIFLLLCVGIIFLREARLPWLSALFALAIATAIFIGFSAPRLSNTTVPAEVVLSRSSSWYIVKGSLLSHFKNTLLGNGLGSFGAAFSQYRDPNFNSDPYAWSLRFNQPNNTFDALLVEGGVLVSVAWLLLLLYTFGTIIKMITVARNVAREKTIIQFFDGRNEKQVAPYLEVLVVAAPWIIVTVGSFFLFYGPALWFVWWLCLGFVAAGVSFCQPKFIKFREYVIEDSPEYTLSFSFGVVVILAVVVIAGVWGVRMYAAEYYYAASLKAPTLDEAAADLGNAINYRSNNEDYHVALAQVYLLQATDASKVEQPSVEKVGLLVQQAVNEARTATQLAPQSVTVWENLAVMYENAAVLIPEARDWALKALDQAHDLEPSNPVLLWRRGNNYALSGKLSEAIKDYEQAIALKQDYVNAYTALAQAYEKNGDTNQAIAVYALLVNADPSNGDYLFNYGRLLYNRNSKGDRDTAEQAWLKALSVQPNYANVLYSLGSLYESRGQKTLAVQYYNRVLALYPTNKDIKNKINALTK